MDRLRAALTRDAAIRPLLETLYAPAPEVLAPADDTIICRCEEVTAGTIRATVDLGAPGPNQVKSMLRTGMGPCQGRVCVLRSPASSRRARARIHKSPTTIASGCR